MTTAQSSDSVSFSGRSKLLLSVLILGVFIVGVGIRFINLTNPPLDFHPWRQLRSATIARGMYYEMRHPIDPYKRDAGIALGKGFEVLEPRIFERIVAWTYVLVGCEYLWIARLYTILIWALGAMGVFFLARRLSSIYGALVSLLYFLFLPYAVEASRIFMPDPLMTVGIIWAAYAFYRWSETHSWKWTLLVGIFSGVTVLIKVYAVYPIAAAAICVVLADRPIRRAITEPKIWAMAVIMFLIPSFYYVFGVGRLSGGYINTWVQSFAYLLLKPRFYVTWLKEIDLITGIVLPLAGLAAIFLLSKPGRFLLFGLWLGYLFMGMSVPALITTHDYYNLPLIPIVALSLAELGHLFFQKLAQQPKAWRVLATVPILIGVGFSALLARNSLVAVDYRPEILGWIKMGRELPRDGAIIAITHDAGTRVIYYGYKFVSLWQDAIYQNTNAFWLQPGEYNDPVWEQKFFDKNTKGYSYFLVTNFSELDAQPALKDILYNQYPYQKGDGYVLFDLRNKK